MDDKVMALPGRYRIAAIQNQSELNQYSYADVRPCIPRCYLVDTYTADDIEALFEEERLASYDAIIVASNACNDSRVHNYLDQVAAKIESFLRAGKGILILFQKKPETFLFLPESLKVSLVDRPEDEDVLTGSIAEHEHSIDHILLRYPRTVVPAELETQCSVNENLKGLYWRYLNPLEDGVYDTLLIDTSYSPERPLLLVSRPDLPHRVVVTSLMLDWQRHKSLFENVVKHTVEGRPQLAIIKKAGSTPFDFEFMLANLRLQKIPYAEYLQMSPDFATLPLKLYNTVILDPAWTPGEIASFDSQISLAQLRQKGVRVIYFDVTPTHQRVTKTTGGEKNFELLARKLIAWLYTKYDESSAGWDDSFLSTASILEGLVDLGEDRRAIMEQYADGVLEYIYKHARDGSYDEVFGATCAMLKTYSLLLGSTHPRVEKSLKWLLTRIDSENTPEKVYGVLILKKVGYHESVQMARALYPEVIRELEQPLSELALDRYAEFLLEFNFAGDLRAVVESLRNLQDPLTGKWANYSRTASIVRSLLRIKDKLRELSPSIDEMIFKAVVCLRGYARQFESTSSGEWSHRASYIMEVVLALVEFESELSFHIDEFVSSLRRSTEIWRPLPIDELTIQIKNIIAANTTLRRENTDLRCQLENTEADQEELSKVSKRGRFAENLSLALIPLTYFLIAVTTVSLIQAFNAWTAVIEFLKEWAEWSVGVVTLIIIAHIAAIINLLKKYERLPEWLEDLTRRIPYLGDQ